MTPERRRRASAAAALLVACVALLVHDAPAQAIDIDDETALALGQRIYRNETGGDPDKLLWWNAGEGFASLGIGHFIWYPEGVEGPFTESFPDLLRFLSASEVALPPWLGSEPDCPWRDRDEFLRARSGPQAADLHRLLTATVAEQSRFMVVRLGRSAGRVTASFPPGPERVHARSQLEALAAGAHGLYVLLDYVNFKGEGLLESERYAGEGWGLRQVVAAMAPGEPASALDRFADAAAEVLTRRVRNAPPARNEARWLPGWLVRVETYRAR